MRLLASDRHMYLNIQQLRTIDSTNYIFVYDVCNKNCFVISLSWIGESQQMYSDLISILDTKLAETKWIRTDFDSFFCRISQIVINNIHFFIPLDMRNKKISNSSLSFHFLHLDSAGTKTTCVLYHLTSKSTPTSIKTYA